MIRVGISFDDSYIAQLKWARTMHKLGLRGTFYISPSALDDIHKLLGWTLPKMAEWGHLIGNHTWVHDAPAKASEEEVLTSIYRAASWLRERGYCEELLALPYGVRGGKWSPSFLKRLQHDGYMLRDVRFKGEAPGSRRLPSALESAATTFTEVEGWPDLRYFHGNHNTSDADMAEFLFALADGVAAGELQVVLPERS